MTKMMSVTLMLYSRQLISSDESRHSGVPLQRSLLSMHWPFLHLNSFWVQTVKKKKNKLVILKCSMDFKIGVNVKDK